MAKKPTSNEQRERLEDEARPEPEQRKGLPDGFARHRGGKMPVEPDERVMLVIRTSEGLGFSGPARARDHEWEHDKHEDGLGAIVGWRPANGTDAILPAPRRLRWPEE